jgi:hypothetical protein
LAAQYGTENTVTLKIDTTISVDSVSFTGFIDKGLQKDTGQIYFSDSNSFHLEDGTEIILIDTFVNKRNTLGLKNEINRKTRVYLKIPEKKIKLKKKLEAPQIIVEKPDKLDVLLKNLKWFAFSVFAIAMLVFAIKKFLI